MEAKLDALASRLEDYDDLLSDELEEAEEAFAYNSLSQSWERILELASCEEESALF